ncbi:MAG: hypothetical protein JNL21_16685 [Myxococcales bacterium]|nr:hypothetical protein [Myxococcales bacterium]
MSLAVGCVSSPSPGSGVGNRAGAVGALEARARPPNAKRGVPSDGAHGSARALDVRIAELGVEVARARFRDVGALTELARLQLVRDSPVADGEGGNDAERALKNATRAVLQDGRSLEARVVLILARARGIDQRRGQVGLCALLEAASSAIELRSDASGPLVEAVRTLRTAMGSCAEDRVMGTTAALGLDALLEARLTPRGRTARTCRSAPDTARVLCAATGSLERAQGRVELEDAAEAVLAAWDAMRSNCLVDDDSCGPYVARGLGAAARALSLAGRPGRAVAAWNELSRFTGKPEADAISQEVALELAEACLGLALLDTAAVLYERAARAPGDRGRAAAARAGSIRSSLEVTPVASPTSCEPWRCALRALELDGSWSSMTSINE